MAAKSTMKTTAKAATKKTAQKPTAKTSAKATAQSSAATATESGLMGLRLSSWAGRLRKAKASEARTGKRGFLIAANATTYARNSKALRALLQGHLNKWQTEHYLGGESEIAHYQGTQGPVWIVRPTESKAESASGLDKTLHAKLRDLCGSIVSQLPGYALDKLVVEFHGFAASDERGALIGLEMGSYVYSENRDNPRKSRKKLPTLVLRTASEQLNDRAIRAAGQLGLCVNIARHLTNLPGGTLNPRTYAEAIENLFSESESVTVEVWSGEKLRQENMNLLMAVGQAAQEGPRFVHVRYRPTGTALGMPPLAIVGKGITFDSGGVDIKPASAMRWMKKDMGGSAAAIAIAKWAELTELAVPLDIYVSLAENAVSGNSFRPGDIITTRNGLTIEIQNTDAEGRLVLADALDVAATAEEKPHAIIDLATLTGAIKVGLGADVAGLFCNHDELAKGLFYSGLAVGDLMWRMPLFQSYKSMLRSSFADHQNSSDGFAGAITAALFLELFVRDIPWAHLDIYAWKDSSGGAIAESGANGQGVQVLAEFLSVFADQGSAQ